MTEEEKKNPPAGMLAETALKEEPKVEPKEDAATLADKNLMATQSTTKLPVDPSYAEPKPLKEFLEMHDKLCLDESDARRGVDGNRIAASRREVMLEAALLQRKALVEFLLSRVRVLEAALQPFAVSSMMMSNARMCLIADSRPEEPAGGIWLSNVQGIQLQPNEGYFYNACDAMGRQRTHDYMCSALESMQQAQEAQVEKAKHVDDGGSVH